MLDMLGLWQYKVRFWEAMRMLSCVELHHPVASVVLSIFVFFFVLCKFAYMCVVTTVLELLTQTAYICRRS